MDHLRTFPLPQQPESWELNETFLSILERECEKWDGSALALQFGNEINFKFLTFDDTAKLIEKHGSLENARVEARKASANGAAMMLDIYESCGGAPHGMDFFSNKIQELCRYIETNTVQLESYFGWEAENMCAHLQEIMLDLQSPEGEISDRAKQNTFLAWLHIMPSAVGGLRDLIEPRFGDFTWGQGWWDEPSEAEVRVAVPPFNPDEAMWDRVSAGITNYHRVWENIFAAAKEFRILTTNSHGYNHLHISFWNKQDSTNLITMQDDLEIADALHHLYIGYVAACANLPMLVQETVNPKYAHGTEFVPNIGTARTDAIRQRENTWEFRHDYTSANFHMARYLVPIMAGIRTGLLYDIKLGDDRPEFKPSIQPVLTHAHDEKSPLRNVLSHCIITEDGHLKVDWDSMTATHGLLMAELGKVFGKNYKTIIGDEAFGQFDLNNSTAWGRLIESIIIDENNNIILPAGLDPEITALFGPLTVTGRRYCLRHLAGNSVPQGVAALYKGLDYFSETAQEFFGFTDVEAEKIRAYYQKTYETHLAGVAESFTTQLKDVMKDVLEKDAGKDDPIDLLKRTVEWFIYKNIIGPDGQRMICGPQGPDGKEKTRDYFKAGILHNVPDRKTSLETTASLTLLLRPHFERAVQAEIATQHLSANVDNFSIAALETVADFIKSDMTRISSYEELDASNLITYFEVFAKMGKLDEGTQSGLCLGYGVKIISMLRIMMADPEISLYETLAEFKDARARAIEDFDRSLAEWQMPEEFEDDNVRTSYANIPRSMELCRTITLEVFDSIIAGVETMITGIEPAQMPKSAAFDRAFNIRTAMI